MSAFSQKSAAALREEAELRANAQELLDARFADAQIVRQPERLNGDVYEVLFTVPSDGRRVERVAWVCRSGSVQIFESWDVP